MKVGLLGEGPHEGDAVALFKKCGEEPAYAVLLIDSVGEALLDLEGIVEVLFRGDGIAILVHELEGKVADHPVEGWEVLGEVFKFLIGLVTRGFNKFDTF